MMDSNSSGQRVVRMAAEPRLVTTNNRGPATSVQVMSASGVPQATVHRTNFQAQRQAVYAGNNAYTLTPNQQAQLAANRQYHSAPPAGQIMMNYSQTGGIRVQTRPADKSKGLRHFSTKVCEKVKEKGRTTYNEVADELVQDYFDSLPPVGGDQEKQSYDMKNIRRRVYDALNVLMAMNIIEKERKEIRWVGLPTSSAQECERLEKEKQKREERIKQKREHIQELLVQMVTYKALVARNRAQERACGRPPKNTQLYLPYIIVSTDKSTTIDCSISHDKTEYLFNFNQPFAIHDDIEVLKRLGLSYGIDSGQIQTDSLQKVLGYVPPALRHYVHRIQNGTLFAQSAPALTSIKQQTTEATSNSSGRMQQLQPAASPAQSSTNTNNEDSADPHDMVMPQIVAQSEASNSNSGHGTGTGTEASESTASYTIVDGNQYIQNHTHTQYQLINLNNNDQ